MSGEHLYIMFDENNKLILKDNNSMNGLDYNFNFFLK